MAAKKFLRLIAGILTEVAGTIVSAGAANDGDLVALDAAGKLDVSVLPTGVGPEVVVLPASEALSAGDLVNVWNDGGVAKARKADNSTAGKEANGFVLAGFAPAASATVFGPSQINTGVAGLTPGAPYWLGVAGAVTATPPTGAGVVSQSVGRATAAGVLVLQPLNPITQA